MRSWVYPRPVDDAVLAGSEGGGNPFILPYRISAFGITAGATQNVSSQVAVIPNDPNGQFEVILESSVDLVTWNVAKPGTFGGDTPRRFFRTRIVRRN